VVQLGTYPSSAVQHSIEYKQFSFRIQRRTEQSVTGTTNTNL